MTKEPERPSCCGECSRYLRDIYEKCVGACDNWAGVQIRPTDVCRPNFGIKKDTKQ